MLSSSKFILSKLNTNVFRSLTTEINEELTNILKLSSNFYNFKQNLSSIRNHYAKSDLDFNSIYTKNYFKTKILTELESFSKEMHIEKKIFVDNIRRKDFSYLYNEYNYLKYPLVEYDLFTAYLIIWGINAKTPIHYHSSNGCCILNLDGLWLENIYDNSGIKIKSNILKSNSISYINNEIGSHQITHLNSYPSISINIYSPSIELQ